MTCEDVEPDMSEPATIGDAINRAVADGRPLYCGRCGDELPATATAIITHFLAEHGWQLKMLETA